MSEINFIGMFVVTGVTIWSVVRSILDFQRTSIKERNMQSEKNTQATQALTEEMIKYVTAFEHHITDDRKRDELLGNYSEKIDKHESRITVLETRGH